MARIAVVCAIRQLHRTKMPWLFVKTSETKPWSFFSIAFEAPENGVNLMEECASSESHFFNTNGEGMRATFQAIGRQINALSLRLTI